MNEKEILLPIDATSKNSINKDTFYSIWPVDGFDEKKQEYSQDCISKSSRTCVFTACFCYFCCCLHGDNSQSFPKATFCSWIV